MGYDINEIIDPWAPRLTGVRKRIKEIIQGVQLPQYPNAKADFSQDGYAVQGAIDNKPTTDQADLKGADNYLNNALNAAMAGKPVAVESTRPYGCSVKYAH